MPRKNQHIRNAAGFVARRVRTRAGHVATRWVRRSGPPPVADPLAGPGIGPLPARRATPTAPVLTSTDLAASPPTTAELHAAVVSAKAAATVFLESTLDVPSIDDLAHEHLTRLAAEQLFQARRTQLLLEARGISDLAHLYSNTSFNDTAERFGLDTALARIRDPRAFEHVADKTLRRELVEDSWRMPPVDVRRDPVTGEVRLYPEDLIVPPHIELAELHLEAERMFPGDASSRLAWVRVQREAAGL